MTYNESEILHFLKHAAQVSLTNINEGNGGPFGAIVVKNGEIISESGNMVTSTNDPTAHAEVMAIRKACEQLRTFQLDGCVIFTSCEPCPMCLGAIYWARPDAVYFANTRKDAAHIGFDDDLIYTEIPLHPAMRKIPMRHYPVTEALDVFKIWQQKENKIEY